MKSSATITLGQYIVVCVLMFAAGFVGGMGVGLEL